VRVDHTQRGRLGGKSCATNRDVALPRLGLQPLDRVVSVTLRVYSHAIADRDKAAAQVIGELLFRPPGEPHKAGFLPTCQAGRKALAP
jgi:hypothetical protein